MMLDALNLLTYDSLKSIGLLIAKNKKTKKNLGIILFILILISAALLLYAGLFIKDVQQRDFILNNIFPAFAVPCIGIIFLFFLSFISIISDSDEVQLEKLRAERIEITQKIESDEKLDIFHTIQLSLNQLNEYYTINKSQARSSFRFSIFAIVIGLITIVCGVWLLYFGYNNIQISIIYTISGAILEFIGGAYFFMYKKSLEQVNFFFGQLIKIQDTMLAINLANGVNDESKRNDLVDKIINSLLERSLK